MKISMIHYWRTVKFWFWETFTYYFIKRHYHTFAKLAVLCLWIISMASCMFEETVIKQKSDAIKWERDTG